MFDFSSIFPYVVVTLVALAMTAAMYLASKELDEITGPISVGTRGWRYYDKNPPPGMSQEWHEDNQAAIRKAWTKMRLDVDLQPMHPPTRAERAANRDMVRRIENIIR